MRSESTSGQHPTGDVVRLSRPADEESEEHLPAVVPRLARGIRWSDVVAEMEREHEARRVSRMGRAA
ncbi:hypothetical protein SAMN05421810_101923 [Amycolatopsis arida]|uniref:Uncharacterized protein n=1 Tax=Amycolatopsis arida TaxID=587909 RepID=A0A1I5MH93_9PSEU|nr:DUF6222 family protein [Amycolatopsis arida]TDX94097.1 hypothetical protein CLV69_104555 [Amycolatopsis arida]SFP09008.1 hypothetical protein SAMN05421810_101923 [Amycolatopsis arida]